MLNIFLIPRPNILKFRTFALGTLKKSYVKFGDTQFFLSKLTNFSSRADVMINIFDLLSEEWKEKSKLMKLTFKID